MPANWLFRSEQCFGRLARPGDLLAIIAARAWLLLAANQDLLQVGDPFRDSGGTIRQLWHTGRGKLGAYPQAQPVAASPCASKARNVEFCWCGRPPRASSVAE